MTDIVQRNKMLDQQIFAGRALEAFEELYDDDVIMQENTEPEHRGKALNRQRELDFYATVEAVHGGRVLASGHNEDVSFSEYEIELTIKGVGRITLAQVAVRHWKHGKIVHERFYHK